MSVGEESPKNHSFGGWQEQTARISESLVALLAARPIRHPGQMGEAEPSAVLLVALGRSALPTLWSQTSVTHLTNSLCGATPLAISMGTLARKRWQENVEPPPDPQLKPAEAGFAVKDDGVRLRQPRCCVFSPPRGNAKAALSHHF